MTRERFPIAELSARSGTPRATIHHYLRLGLLPQPTRASANRFLYDERHVRALRVIEALRRRRRMPLPVVRRILPDLLAMEEDEAFRPEMWDRAVDVRTRARARRTPAARLLDAAVDAFARRGFADVGVDDLCRAARIAKGSFYRHHRSKEDVFLAAAEAAGAQVAAAFARAMPADAVLEEIAGDDRAAEVLSIVLEPRLPIFLDLLARASQRRPGYPAAATRVFGALADAVGRHLGCPDPAAAGEAMIEGALGQVVHRFVAAKVPPAPAARGSVSGGGS